MGIRIHKVLGYGLTDVEFDRENWKGLDPRINWGSPSMPYGTNDEADDADYKPEPTTEEYLAWVKKKYEDTGNWTLDSWIKQDDPDFDKFKYRMYDCIHYQPEYGEKNVLIVRPVSCPDWSRYDDTIDYMESAHPVGGGQPCINSVQTFEDGIYPFTNVYRDSKTGEILKWDDIMWWIRAKNNRRDKELTDEDVAALDMAAQAAGFKDHADAYARIAPEVPDVIQDLCEFTGLFADPDAVHQLRPMIYTYWS